MANGTLAVIRKMYNWAVSRDLVETSPCVGVRGPGTPKARDRTLSAEEIAVFWSSLDRTDMSVGVRLALRLQLVTAQRIGEVVSMRWSDIEEADAVWTVPGEIAKNKLAHRVPLTELAISLIEQAPKIEDSPWVFPSPQTGGHINANAAARALRRNRDIHQIENFRPHDLRRTAASHMTSLGIPRLVVGKILNHAEPGVTAVYDRHSYDLEKREALEKWANRLAEIIS